MRFLHIQSDEDRREVERFICEHGAGLGGDSGMEDKLEAARRIVEDVRTHGDAAVAEFTARFDGVELKPEQFEVTPEEIDAAVAEVDPELRAILERAHENIRWFHSQNLRESWEKTFDDGTILGQRISPIARAGVYVPGGKAFYPSSVLMNIVPAKVAGVPEVVMVSPPSFNGGIHPVVLAAAKLAGATRVFRIGGAQAVAALAYGTETIPPVCKITGPGNTFVTAAKALIRHVAEIDSEAGPSEVVVLADGDADPQFVAAEMLAQAEHDEEALAVLITDSEKLAKAVQARLDEQAPKLPKADIIAKALERQGAIIIARSLDEAIELTDLFAPEHLSIQTRDPRACADRIHDAGAVMLGAMTPVAVGDYYAGPNHILPTWRRARFSSPLTAEAFRKVSSIIHYSEARIQAVGEDIVRFAQAEELHAHAQSIEVRMAKEKT